MANFFKKHLGTGPREAEERRNEEVRRELKLEIERERTQARQRAEEQGKQLDISIDEKEGEDIGR